MTLRITSAAFGDNGEVPAVHTCEGQDTSPPLSFSGVPENAASLALIVDDPDALERAMQGHMVEKAAHTLPGSLPRVDSCRRGAICNEGT